MSAMEETCRRCGDQPEMLLDCADCLEATYCSPLCQYEDWTGGGHRLACAGGGGGGGAGLADAYAPKRKREESTDLEELETLSDRELERLIGEKNETLDEVAFELNRRRDNKGRTKATRIAQRNDDLFAMGKDELVALRAQVEQALDALEAEKLRRSEGEARPAKRARSADVSGGGGGGGGGGGDDKDSLFGTMSDEDEGAPAPPAAAPAVLAEVFQQPMRVYVLQRMIENDGDEENLFEDDVTAQMQEEEADGKPQRSFADIQQEIVTAVAARLARRWRFGEGSWSVRDMRVRDADYTHAWPSLRLASAAYDSVPDVDEVAGFNTPRWWTDDIGHVLEPSQYRFTLRTLADRHRPLLWYGDTAAGLRAQPERLVDLRYVLGGDDAAVERVLARSNAAASAPRLSVSWERVDLRLTPAALGAELGAAMLHGLTRQEVADRGLRERARERGYSVSLLRIDNQEDGEDVAPLVSLEFFDGAADVEVLSRELDTGFYDIGRIERADPAVYSGVISGPAA